MSSNAHSHGSSGPPPLPSYTSAPGSSMYPRRSSYASVVSGAAPSASTQTYHTSRSLSHIINATPANTHTSQHPSAHHSQHPSGRGIESDGHHNGMSGSWGKGGQLPSYSSQFGHSGNVYYGGTSADNAQPFFIPTYLKGSRFAEKLEETHRAKTAPHRDSRSTHSSNPGSLSTSSSSINLHKLVPSHRGMTHEIIERAPVYVEDTVPPLPSRWNENDKAPGIDITGNGLTIKFNGMNKTNEEAASVRTDFPMPRQCGIYYYEVNILSKGKDSLIGVGFSGSKVALSRLPGWETDSWAYHGDDGMTFNQHATGKSYGPKYNAHDIIGCGINFRTGTAFFTKNGVNLHTAFTSIKIDRVYPSIGMKKPGESIKANFGQTPFVFDIDGLIRREKAIIHEDIMKTSITNLSPPLDESALIHQLIAQYLAHDGYVETARAFAEEVREEAKALSSSTDLPLEHLDPEEDLDAINRQRIRSAILDGDMDRALKHTTACYPNVLHNNENIYFKIRCRKYIEMIRKCAELQNSSSPSKKPIGMANGRSSYADDHDVFDHQMELDEQLNPGSSLKNGKQPWDQSERMDTEDDANGVGVGNGTGGSDSARYNQLLAAMLQYGSELRTEFSQDPRREVKKALDDTLALIAYDNPADGPLGGLLDVKGRVPVAEELNSAILVSLGKSEKAALERLCQQTEVLVQELAEDGGAGAFVNVRGDYMA